MVSYWIVLTHDEGQGGELTIEKVFRLASCILFIVTLFDRCSRPAVTVLISITISIPCSKVARVGQ
jgi:hypothetical protein